MYERKKFLQLKLFICLILFCAFLCHPICSSNNEKHVQCLNVYYVPRYQLICLSVCVSTEIYLRLSANFSKLARLTHS